MLAVLKNPTYRKLFSAQMVALIGTGLLTVALGLLAFDLAGENAGAVMGTALTIKMLAYVGFAPVVNAVVAHLPKKPVLIGADIIRAAMALCLPFITEAWQIYVVIFLLQSASATFTPAFQSLIPAVLPEKRDYTRALSLSRLAYDMEALVSPVLAAVFLTIISYNNLFLGTVAGFVLSAILVATTVLPKGSAGAGAPSSLWHRTTLGTRIFWRNPRLRSLLALNFVVAAPTALVLVNTVVYVRDILGRSDADLAIALASFGVGSMIVALVAPSILDRFGDRPVMLSGAVVIPLAMAGATVVTYFVLDGDGGGWLWLLAMWFLLGAGNSTILTPSSRLLRDASTDETSPYVFTAQFSLSHACFIITYPLAGLLGATAGLGAAALALTILAVAGGVAAILSWPSEGTQAVDSTHEEQGLEQSS